MEHSRYESNLVCHSQNLEELLPVTFLYGLGLELREYRIGLEQTSERLLHILKSSILPHSIGHLLGRRKEAIDGLSDLSRLHRTPRGLPELGNLAPDSGQRRPYCLEVTQFFEDGLQSVVSYQIEVKCLLGPTNKVIIVLDTGDLALENVDGVKGGICS